MQIWVLSFNIVELEDYRFSLKMESPIYTLLNGLTYHSTVPNFIFLFMNKNGITICDHCLNH